MHVYAQIEYLSQGLCKPTEVSKKCVTNKGGEGGGGGGEEEEENDGVLKMILIKGGL